MDVLSESELIVNADGSIYHLALKPGELADNVITVGDPDRVPMVSRYFDRIEYQRQHREFVTHTGYINDHRITVISTGIGTDNIDIAFNELDALVNIDFETRSIKPEKTSLDIVRIGTCGALQSTLDIDQPVVSVFGLGFDNLLLYYDVSYSDKETEMHDKLKVLFSDTLFNPYVASASDSLLDRFRADFNVGLTATCSGFYGPQGRILRAPLCEPSFVDRLQGFDDQGLKILSFDMETSGIYGLGKLLNHRCLSVATVVANRATKAFSKDIDQSLDQLIQTVLERLIR